MTENTLDSTAPGPCAALSHSRSSGLVHRVPSNLSPRHPSGGSLSGSCPLPPAPSHLLSGHFAACFLLPVTLLLKKSKGHRRLSAKVQGLSRQPWRWTPPGLLLAEVVSLTSPGSCLTVGAVLSVLLPPHPPRQQPSRGPVLAPCSPLPPLPLSSLCPWKTLVLTPGLPPTSQSSQPPEVSHLMNGCHLSDCPSPQLSCSPHTPGVMSGASARCLLTPVRALPASTGPPGSSSVSSSPCAGPWAEASVPRLTPAPGLSSVCLILVRFPKTRHAPLLRAL